MLALLLAMLFLFAACGGDKAPTDSGNNNNNTPNTSGGNNDSTPENNNPDEENQNKPLDPTLRLSGVDISEFSIVYEIPKEKYQMGQYWREEYDSGKVTATRLAALIQEKFGVTLEVYADMESGRTEKEHEILIGNTNRTQSKSDAVKALTTDQFIVAMDSGKLVICGGAPGTTYHAVDNIEAYFASTVKGNYYVIDTTTPLSGEYHLERIAILGDSISYGALSTDYTNNNGRFGYAAQTGRMYWQECVVKSYAMPGVCLRQDLNGFAVTSLWKNFRNDMRAEKFDTVLIMLGVNDGYADAKTGNTWDGVWTEQDDKNFLKDMTYMVQSIHMENEDAEVVVMNCPVYYRSGDPSSSYYYSSHYHSSPRIIALQAQSVTDLRAKGADYVHLYDMNSYTNKNTPVSMYPDCLHPNDQGHEIIAEGVVAMLKLLREGKTDQYLVN